MIRKIILIVTITVSGHNAATASEVDADYFAQLLPYALLSNAIYKDASAVKRVATKNNLDFELLKTIPGIKITYAILKQISDERKVIVIRGTANAENAAVDMDFKLIPDKLSDVSLHQGFKDASTAIFQKVIEHLSKDDKIITTGHSLGGAAALVLGMQLQAQGFKIDRVITFGQPKVTNLAGSHKFSDMNVVRVVIPKDPVPIVPPLDPIDVKNIDIYWHVGTEIVLLGSNKYAVLDGVKAMLRGAEFLTYVPERENIESHFMQTYLTMLLSNSQEVTQVKYSPSFNFKNLLNAWQ